MASRLVVHTISTATIHEEFVIELTDGADVDQQNWSGWEDAFATGVAKKVTSIQTDVDGIKGRRVEKIEAAR